MTSANDGGLSYEPDPLPPPEPGQQEFRLRPRPPMEIGNVWIHDNQPSRIHYMIHWYEDGVANDRHMVELDGTALAKILRTRLR